MFIPQPGSQLPELPRQTHTTDVPRLMVHVPFVVVPAVSIRGCSRDVALKKVQHPTLRAAQHDFATLMTSAKMPAAVTAAPAPGPWMTSG